MLTCRGSVYNCRTCTFPKDLQQSRLRPFPVHSSRLLRDVPVILQKSCTICRYTKRLTVSDIACKAAQTKEEDGLQTESEIAEVSQMEYNEPITEDDYRKLMDLPMPHSKLQQTLQKSFTIAGPGLHSADYSGCVGKLRVRPALAGEGRYFVVVSDEALSDWQQSGELDEREDLSLPESEDGAEASFTHEIDEAEEIVPKAADEQVVVASVESLVLPIPGCLFTTLQSQETRIFNPEALLAALEACGVDNARIEICGGEELPASDGSAVEFVTSIQQAGTRVAPALDGVESAPKQLYVAPKVVTVRNGDAFVSMIPSSGGSRVSVGIEHTVEAPIIGCQWASWSPQAVAEHHFCWTVAPARPFATSPQEVLDRRAEGYFKGAAEPFVLIADWDQWYHQNEVRFATDEPARRRLLEFVGDLSLLSKEGRGGIPQGHIVAYKATKELTSQFLRAVQRVCRS